MPFTLLFRTYLIPQWSH